MGLGFATCVDAETKAVSYLCDKAWINGGSPTFGFLKFGTVGPFASFYQGLADSVLVEWLFMLGLLFIGVALTSGILVRLGGLVGVLLMLLMYLGLIPPKNNPFLDEHLIYALVMLGFVFVHTCRHLGLGYWWSNLGFVKRNWILH